MAVTYISGAAVAAGSYTVPAGLDRQMLYMVTSENNGFVSELTNVTYGGEALALVISDVLVDNQLWVHIFRLDEAGIAAAIGDAFIETWSAGTVTDQTFACTLAGVNQAIPINDQSLTSNLSNDPVKPLISSGDGGLIFELCGTGGGGATWVWTPAFTQQQAYDNGGWGYAVATQDVATGGSIQTEFDDSIISRSYLAAIAFNEVNFDPYISSLTGGAAEELNLASGHQLIGGNFGATQGTGFVTISPTNNIADTRAVVIQGAYTFWNDSTVVFTLPLDSNLKYGELFTFVTNDSGLVGTGYSAPLTTNIAVTSKTIESISPLGIYKNITGIELSADIVEYQNTSAEGGEVTVLLSGIAEANYAPLDPPVSDTFTFRIFDDSNYRWSTASTATLTDSSVSGAILVTVADTTSTIVATIAVDGTVVGQVLDVTSTTSGQITIDGNLTEVIDSIVATTSGQITLNGAVAATLDSVTSAASAQITLDSTLNETLDDVSASTAGQITIEGGLLESLDSVISVATGNVGSAGSLNEVLDDFTSEALGSVGGAAGGIVNVTLDNFTGALAGDITIDGLISEALDDFTGNSSGTITVTGSSNTALEDVTSIASGGIGFSGSLNETIDDFTSVAAGEVEVGLSGTLAETLDNIIASAVGDITISGSIASTLENTTANISAGILVPLVGSISETLENVISLTVANVDSPYVTAIQTYERAVLSAMGSYDLPHWSAAIESEQRAVLAETFFYMSRMIFTMTDGTIIQLLITTPEEYAALPLPFIKSLRLAQLKACDCILENSAKSRGLMVKSVGESSEMYRRGKGVASLICGGALSHVARYL